MIFTFRHTILFIFYNLYLMCINVCLTVCLVPIKFRRVLSSPVSAVKMVRNHHADVRNRSQVLFKTRKCSSMIQGLFRVFMRLCNKGSGLFLNHWNYKVFKHLKFKLALVWHFYKVFLKLFCTTFKDTLPDKHIFWYMKLA